MRVTWVHGVGRLRGTSMDKWVDRLLEAITGDPDAGDLHIDVDQIEGVPLPFFRGLGNRYLFYSLHALSLRSDLFHIHDHANAHVVPLLPAEAPKIVTVHDLYMLEQSRLQAKSFPFRLCNVRGIRRADHIISVSGYMREEIARRLGFPADRISVAYCGIDHAIYRPGRPDKRINVRYGLPQGARYLLFVGSELPRKNIGAVLEVVKRLARENDDLYLLKVGNPGSRQYRKKTLRKLEALKLTGRVVFTGFVAEAELPGLYRGANLLLAPSFYEGGSGIHVIEAMACGCPVVASGIPQSRELVEGAAVLCDPSDSEDIYAAARSLLEDETLRADMIGRGLSRAAGFSWARSAAHHLQIYRRFGA